MPSSNRNRQEGEAEVVIEEVAGADHEEVVEGAPVEEVEEVAGVDEEDR